MGYGVRSNLNNGRCSQSSELMDIQHWPRRLNIRTQIRPGRQTIYECADFFVRLRPQKRPDLIVRLESAMRRVELPEVVLTI